MLIYFTAIFFVFRWRNYAETKARSPYITMLCLFLLCLDSSMNTAIIAQKQTNQEVICLIGLWTTMMLMVPILMTVYIRVKRVAKVFELYESYLNAVRNKNKGQHRSKSQ